MRAQRGPGWGRAVATAALGVWCLAGATQAPAEVRIAVVDMQRALNECSAGRKAKEQVKAKFERAQDQLKRQRDELDRLRDDLERKAEALSVDARREREKDLESRALEFKRKSEDFQRDLKRTDAELTAGIVEELYSIVADYGREQGYGLVLEASNGGLLYADKGLDITDEVVRRHDAGYGRRAKRSED